MKLWGTLRRDNRIIQDATEELSFASPTQVDDWNEALSPLCRRLDISHPVLLQKHRRDLIEFSRSVFKKGDFMEEVDFDRFEVEIFLPKKPDKR